MIDGGRPKTLRQALRNTTFGGDRSYPDDTTSSRWPDVIPIPCDVIPMPCRVIPMARRRMSGRSICLRDQARTDRRRAYYRSIRLRSMAANASLHRTGTTWRMGVETPPGDAARIRRMGCRWRGIHRMHCFTSHHCRSRHDEVHPRTVATSPRTRAAPSYRLRAIARPSDTECRSRRAR
jgi:hypothetical protein